MASVNITTNAMLPITPKEVAKTSDGLVIYETKNPQTETNSRFSIPEENKDKFEKLVQEVHTKYGKYNINPKEKFAKAAHIATLIGAVAGGSLTAAFIKTETKLGKLTKTLVGALCGVLASNLALTGAILYPFFKYAKEMNKLGYKPIASIPQTIKEEKIEPAKKEEQQTQKTEKE